MLTSGAEWNSRKHVVCPTVPAVIKQFRCVYVNILTFSSNNGECAKLRRCLALCMFPLFYLCSHLPRSRGVEIKRAAERQTSKCCISIHQIFQQISDTQNRESVRNTNPEGAWGCLHGAQLQVSTVDLRLVWWRLTCLLTWCWVCCVYVSGWRLSPWGGSAVLQVMAGIIQTLNTETFHCASQSPSVADCCLCCWLMKTLGSAQQVKHQMHSASNQKNVLYSDTEGQGQIPQMYFVVIEPTVDYKECFHRWWWLGLTFLGLVRVRQSVKTLQPIDELKKGPFMLQIQVQGYQQTGAGVEVDIRLSATSRSGCLVWESVLTLLSKSKSHTSSSSLARTEHKGESPCRIFVWFLHQK